MIRVSRSSKLAECVDANIKHLIGSSLCGSLPLSLSKVFVFTGLLVLIWTVVFST